MLVTVHYAQTLDGRIACVNGDSRWISCPDSLVLAHRLRSEHQAVLVGIGTVLADDPQLTVRLVPGPSPMRVVVDSTGRLPVSAQVLNDQAKSLVATTPGTPDDRAMAWKERGAEVMRVSPDEQGKMSLASVLHELEARGIESVLIEGGSRIITAALRLRLVDRLIVCIAPKLLGQGIEAIGELGTACMADAINLLDVRYEHLGDDLIVHGRLSKPSSTAR